MNYNIILMMKTIYMRLRGKFASHVIEEAGHKLTTKTCIYILYIYYTVYYNFN